MRSRFPPAAPYYHYSCSSPAIAPLVQVAIVPETIERKPSSVISRRRSGTIAPEPADQDAERAKIGETAERIGDDQP
jgi:hypothetical protein